MACRPVPVRSRSRIAARSTRWPVRRIPLHPLAGAPRLRRIWPVRRARSINTATNGRREARHLA